MRTTKTFYTSDSHYGHAKIIELAGRPFKDIDDMNETLVRRWNETVDPGDIVYHLGDVALGKFVDSIKFISRLNGHKILVPGNHDRVWHDGKQEYIDRFWPLYLEHFQEIWPEQSVSHEGFRMSHLPYTGDSHHDDRYADVRPVPEYPGQWIVNGHVHEKWKVKDHQINVGVDVWDFKPVSSGQIYEIMRSGN